MKNRENRGFLHFFEKNYRSAHVQAQFTHCFLWKTLVKHKTNLVALLPVISKHPLMLTNDKLWPELWDKT